MRRLAFVVAFLTVAGAAWAAPANPATATRDVRKLLRFAIENESSVQIKYKRNTNEEVLDAIQPESLNGDKLFPFSDQEQSYCAYRIKRILSVQLD